MFSNFSFPPFLFLTLPLILEFYSFRANESHVLECDYHEGIISLNVTKYRRQVITADILRRLGEIFKETCDKWRCTLSEFNGEADHVHLLISFPPDVQVSTLVGNLKTVSSRLIRRDFPDHLARFYRKPVFWSGSYFVASCGGVTIEHLRKYVEDQARPLV